MYKTQIFMIIINGNIWEDYGYFDTFEDAKKVAAKIAAERGAEEVSWKSEELFSKTIGDYDYTIGVICIDHHTNAAFQ